MPIVGVETLTFGVADLETSVRFHEDFGLVLDERTPGHARFRLAEGSTVEFRPSEDPVMPPAFLDGPGPREIVWGVASAEALAALAEDLGRDREVAVDPDGTLHLTDDGGMRIGFRRFERVPLALETAPGENNLSQTTRWNRHRKWYESARPKVINHVVFGLPEVERTVDFYVERLGFRVTDIIRGFGVFLRCDGRHDHHNLLLFRAGKRLFSHVSFGVETIDELMTGANLMQRRGWSSELGLGRHRASSMVFYYIKSPAGGQAEYSADSDYLTDDWKPRLWDAEYAQHHWVAAAPQGSGAASPAGVEIIEGPIPRLSDTVRRPAG